MRAAVGDDIDIAVHCHNQWDTPSAIAVSRATESIKPLFFEDPLSSVEYCESWMAVKRATRTPILTGEKLEMVKQFKPFIDTQAVDIIHPDVSYAGGISGCRRIADYAALYRTPMALHNVGTLVRTYASVQLAAAIPNFYRSENRLGRPGRMVEKMAGGKATGGQELDLSASAGAWPRSRNRPRLHARAHAAWGRLGLTSLLLTLSELLGCSRPQLTDLDKPAPAGDQPSDSALYTQKGWKAARQQNTRCAYSS